MDNVKEWPIIPKTVPAPNPIQRPSRKVSYSKGLINADDAMNVLRRKMYDFDVGELAEKADISRACVMAIRSGRTKWPRPKTFFNLLKVLDLKMLLVDKNG